MAERMQAAASASARMRGMRGTRAVGEAWQPNYSMARLSSWRAGGEAAWLFTPQRLAQAGDNPMLTLPYALPPQVRARCGREKPLFVGYGSNLLVRDGGYDGIVVRTAPGLDELREQADGSIRAGAGVGCPKLARFCAERGWDATFFSGIPGTVGGALAMNAGCHGDETWRHVQKIFILSGGEVRQQQCDDFEVGYRKVRYKHGKDGKHDKHGADVYFALAEFRFPPGDAEALKQKTKTLLQQRAATQPIGNASAGSVFCNPPNDHAGRLIEQCGLKNARIGDAVVSSKHANFIVNQGSARAADIEQLILHVQTQVAEKTGTMLTPEVRIVGRAA